MGYLGNAPADQAVQIGDGVVDTDQLANDAVTSAKIEDLAVDTEHIAASAIETAKINADAVTNAKIGDGEVDTEHLAALAVETAKINNDAVTGDKIENSPTVASNLTVTGTLTSGAITSAEAFIFGSASQFREVTRTTLSNVAHSSYQVVHTVNTNDDGLWLAFGSIPSAGHNDGIRVAWMLSANNGGSRWVLEYGAGGFDWRWSSNNIRAQHRIYSGNQDMEVILYQVQIS